MAIHKWSEIEKKFSPERRARLDADVRREVLAMELRELRQEAGELEVVAVFGNKRIALKGV
jgi:hypothetical protein